MTLATREMGAKLGARCCRRAAVAEGHRLLRQPGVKRGDAGNVTIRVCGQAMIGA